MILTEDRKEDAELLGAAVLLRARNSGARRAEIQITDDASVLSKSQEPDEPNTIAVILSRGPGTATSAFISEAAGDCMRNMIPVLPVYDPRAGAYRNQVPSILYPINGSPWDPSHTAETTAEKVLKLGGISEEDQRIFISYRQVDATALADQLRRALIDEGWDVFLDRFSVPPGADFQKRLDRELADKAFVLLLETPTAAESQWVDHEIAFALQRRLGLLSLTSPETSDPQLYPAIHESWRLRMNTKDIQDPGLSCQLTASALERVLLAIGERHAEAVALRRQSTMLEASAEMTALGYDVRPIDQWGLLGIRGLQREVALVTARAPEAADLRRLDTLRRHHRKPGSKTRGWVVHPSEDVDADRVSLLEWMSKHRTIRSTPLMLLADRVQQ
ncbi:toll/interleukin-1 receptor domain-containing protein [Arthrobacter bambusae]|uniref:toll/interleukin-1 receptor domain-containing protein n=1 Tax=Arthrobacter bambusae TaxID=1338426 RepID=UPI001F50D028|nr:toll/interleukin-1 receptor domain-containing protein [Arthrobacter bambusae]MCI0144156.1 toll/interleukin-1 receptor domain-containing protein [Arthrobacter bambusae]